MLMRKCISVVVALALALTSLGFLRGGSKPNTDCFNLVAVGDSITVGLGATNVYPANIGTTLGTSYSSQAVSGIGWDWKVTVFGNQRNLTQLAPADVDPLLASMTCSNGVGPKLILFAGINDIFNNGQPYGPQTYALFQTYYNARIAAGWLPSQVIVATAMPPGATYESSRSVYNASLVSGAPAAGYALARLDLDPNIGCASCGSNPTYFQGDQLHPNNTGLQIVANIICLAMGVQGGNCPAY